MVGEPGRGVPTIIEMVGHTRLDCVIGTAAGMRWGVANATWHAAHRSAFGKLLAEQPLMRNVLADLCVESEAATALAMRLARAYDEAAAGDARAAAFKRLATAVAQVLGLQARPRPRLRGARVPRRQRLRRGVGHAAAVSRGAADVDLGGLGQRHGARRAARAGAAPAVARRRSSTSSTRPPAPTRGSTRSARGCARARRPGRRSSRARGAIVERMALALQGSLLVRHAPPAVADAFCASRLAGDGGLAYGTLPAGVDAAAIVARHTPSE